MTPFEKAERAKQLLDDPLLKEVLARIREGLVLKLEASVMDDVDTHHTTALSLQLLKQLTTELHRYIGESAVINARQKHDSFITRMRERIA
jgi:hypothetical protein